jgi:hypothetical protein
MLVNKSSKKLHEDIKINSNNSTIKGNMLVRKYFWPEIQLFENYMKKKLFISAFNVENSMKIR